MESNVQLKEIDINNRTRYYFDDIVKIKGFDLDNILKNKMKNHTKIFYFITFHTKL